MGTRLMFAASLTLVAAFAVASPASAEPGNGADVVNDSDCETDSTDYDNGIICFDRKWVTNTTTTPSGNHFLRVQRSN